MPGRIPATETPVTAADRLQDDVEARHLRGEYLASERGAVAQLVEADEVDALVEERPSVQEPRQQPDVRGDDQRERGELGCESPAVPACAVVGPAVYRFSQSTRPIHLSRLAAYHAIVRATPSSHETLGAQPVSRCSLS